MTVKRPGRPTVYIESSVPSYLVARPSRSLFVRVHQEYTRRWWVRRSHEFDLCVSEVVLDEIAKGDAAYRARRLDVVSGLRTLPAQTQVAELAAVYVRRLPMPQKALRDAAHLAFACWYAVDYLLTWNCAHIANAQVQKRLRSLNASLHVHTPIICTPEELFEEP